MSPQGLGNTAVYNVEPYIGRCIESLRAQTMQDLEFVFVNDCSTDGSPLASSHYYRFDYTERRGGFVLFK